MMRVFLFVLMVSGYAASACDCDDPSKLKFRDALWVVTGKMKKIEYVRDSAIVTAIKWPSFSRSPIVYKLTFEVDSVLKGDVKTKLVTVYTHSIDMSDCGFPVIDDDYQQRYEIYASVQNGYAYTWMCTESRIMLDLEKEKD